VASSSLRSVALTAASLLFRDTTGVRFEFGAFSLAKKKLIQFSFADGKTLMTANRVQESRSPPPVPD
jgi:hypothetical protein